MSLGEVYKALEESQAGTRLLLVDACRNDPLVGGVQGGGQGEAGERDAAADGARRRAAWRRCSAARRGEKSYESEKLEHGVFFHFVIEGLKGEAANKKGEVTLQRLAAYVTDEVPDAAKEVGDDGAADAAAGGRPERGRAAGDGGDRDEITNTIGMKLKLIKPGKFLMGSPKDEEGRYDNEGPQHEVEITKAFYMGVYPVTKGQFAAFVKDDGYQTDAEKDGKGGWATTRRRGSWSATRSTPGGTRASRRRTTIRWSM